MEPPLEVARVTSEGCGTVEGVYRQHGPRIWRAVFAYCRDREIASDALAEASAQLLRRGDRVRDPAAWAWRAAFRIAAGAFVAWAAFRPAGGAGPIGAADQAAPDVLRISCAADGTPRLSATTVRTQPDGLHVIVDDPGPADEIWLQQPSRPGVTWSSGSSDLGEELAMPVPRGETYVQCRDQERLPEPPRGDAWMARAPHFTLIDPDGNWVPSDLACRDAGGIDSRSVSDPGLFGLSAAEAARMAVPGIRDTDVVEPTGYVASPHEAKTVRVVRDGTVIAVLRQSEGDPGLFFGEACLGSGIGGA